MTDLIKIWRRGAFVDQARIAESFSEPEQARKELSGIEYCDDPYSCIPGVDTLVVLTEWRQFRALDLGRIKQVMAAPVIVDLRNIYRPEDVRSLGFRYESVGRPSGLNETANHLPLPQPGS